MFDSLIVAIIARVVTKLNDISRKMEIRRKMKLFLQFFMDLLQHTPIELVQGRFESFLLHSCQFVSFPSHVVIFCTDLV